MSGYVITLIKGLPYIALTTLIGLVIKRKYNEFYSPQLIYYKSQYACFPEQNCNIYTIVIENIGKTSAKNIKAIFNFLPDNGLNIISYSNWYVEDLPSNLPKTHGNQAIIFPELVTKGIIQISLRYSNQMSIPIPLAINHESGIVEYNTTLIVKTPTKLIKFFLYYCLICAIILHMYWLIKLIPFLLTLIDSF